ncbi:MAG: beta-lactamase family protein [Deltaproteobacteria bacterium]|nr:beta-lactamase family protein [Deltaproteobacteria bacterium]
MNTMTKIAAGITVLAFMLAGCAGMPKKPEVTARGDYSYTKEYVSWLARKEMKKHDVTGLSIALVDDQKVVWAEGFGYADKADKIPAAPETIYRAGSISKLFTATAVMQLVEKDKFDIDKPLKTYLPEFSIKSRFTDAAPITPRTLMTHHSGLPSDLLKGMWTRNPEPFENEVNLLREEYAAYPPNYVFSYSNVGVTLLGHALEKVAGRDFAAHMKTSVLSPLEMTHSAFSQAPDRSPLGAKAYRKAEEAEELPLRGTPAGGLNSNVLDLSRFIQMVLAGGRAGEQQIIKPETLAEMLRPQNADVPLDLNFHTGLGWALSILGNADIRNAGPVIHHSGATLYHRSMLIVLPEHKLGVVVLANSATAGNVVNKLAAEALKLALEAKSGIKQPDQSKAPVGEGSMSQEALKAYEGRYATMAGVIGITKKSDYLQAYLMNNSFRLVPRPDGLLGLQYRLLGIIPISLGELDQVGISRATVAGREIVKASMNGQEVLVGERITPVPISEAWQTRVGEYEIANAGDDAILVDKIRLRRDNGLLQLEYAMPLFIDGRMSIAIAPLSDKEALIYGLGRGMGETIRVVTVGGEERLQYSGYLFKKKRE